MHKLKDAKDILRQMDVPERQQSDLCGYVLLALAQISEEDAWAEARNKWMRIHDIIVFLGKTYHLFYAENSRENIRKQAIHHFRNAAFVEDNGKPTNSPHYSYRLTREMRGLLRSYDSPKWSAVKEAFLRSHDSLIEIYRSKKKMRKIPVKINGADFRFSPGKHNELQKFIIEEFAPRFAGTSECLYVGDTIQKDLVKNEGKLKELGFETSLHDKMPDVVLYAEDKHWVYFIEAVTSGGPMDPKRIKEIEDRTKEMSAGKIYLTAFLDFRTFKRFSDSLAWETEVWIAEMPEHMIHFNGDRFMGPR